MYFFMPAFFDSTFSDGPTGPPQRFVLLVVYSLPLYQHIPMYRSVPLRMDIGLFISHLKLFIKKRPHRTSAMNLLLAVFSTNGNFSLIRGVRTLRSCTWQKHPARAEQPAGPAGAGRHGARAPLHAGTPGEGALRTEETFGSSVVCGNSSS